MARMLHEEAEFSGVGMNRSAEGEIVKLFERFNGLDTALYKKNYLYLYIEIDKLVSRC